MKNRTLWWAVRIVAVLVLAAGTSALAQAPMPTHFSGLINDYTPQTCPQQQSTPPGTPVPATCSTSVSGPWEMRGTWSLNLEHDGTIADFSAAINMTHSDYWVTINGSPSVAVNDNSSTTGRHPHTHYITITDGTVTWISTSAPEEFTVTGPVKVTNDGGPTPFESACEASTPSPCTLTVDIKGGTPNPSVPTFTVLRFSNITMTFSGPLTGHFGPQAIHGVVRSAKNSDSDDHDQDHDRH